MAPRSASSFSRRGRKAWAQVPANCSITSGGNRNPQGSILRFQQTLGRHLATVDYRRPGFGGARHDPTSVVIDCRNRSRPGRHAPPGHRTPRPRRALRTCADNPGNRRRLVPDELDAYRRFSWRPAGGKAGPGAPGVDRGAGITPVLRCVDGHGGALLLGRIDDRPRPHCRIDVCHGVAPTMEAGTSAGRGRRRGGAGSAHRFSAM
jgi:hypothetical protein